jgi:hypothetical protein
VSNEDQKVLTICLCLEKFKQVYKASIACDLSCYPIHINHILIILHVSTLIGTKDILAFVSCTLTPVRHCIK